MKNSSGWEMSVVPIELTQRGKEIFGKEVIVCPARFMSHQSSSDIA